MAKVLGGMVLGVALVLVVEFFFLTGGGMPVATKGGPLPLERMVTGRALHNAIAKDADRPSPLQPDEANLVAGARVYKAQCEICHGALGDAHSSAIAAGMFPRPPLLLPPKKGVADDPVGETWWKVKNGIRLTGMPGFEGSLSSDQLWQVSLLLAKADQLPDAVKAALH